MSATHVVQRERVTVRSIADRVEIAPGIHMPRLGLGTSRSYPGEVEREIDLGFKIGYRLVDTAAAYRNEVAVGRALRRSGVPREEYFLTSKLWNTDQGYDSALAAFEESCDRLGVEYLDLYLVHWPQAETTADTWRALERLHDEGVVRAIGVSNFMPDDLELLLRDATVTPAIDQFEFHPWMQRPEVVERCRELGITVQAWAPLMRGHVGEVHQLIEIGRRYGKTPAQVSLRWILQQGITAIPKSVREERLRENASLYDFELTDEEMDRIAGLDRHQHAQ